MPAKDIYHDAVRNALIKDGWTITHDPYTITFGVRRGYIDLGAEQPLAAEKDGRKIAVEIKSFIGISTMADLQQAVGQYVVYKSWLVRIEPERVLFMAVSDVTYEEVFRDVSAQVLVEDYGINLVVVNIEREEVVQWTG